MFKRFNGFSRTLWRLVAAERASLLVAFQTCNSRKNHFFSPFRNTDREREGGEEGGWPEATACIKTLPSRLFLIPAICPAGNEGFTLIFMQICR